MGTRHFCDRARGTEPLELLEVDGGSNRRLPGTKGTKSTVVRWVTTSAFHMKREPSSTKSDAFRGQSSPEAKPHELLVGAFILFRESMVDCRPEPIWSGVASPSFVLHRTATGGGGFCAFGS